MNALRVFDSWALLAWLLDQPAASHIQTLLEKADDARDEFLARSPALPIRLILPDLEAVIDAAKLKSTRRISYADAFAAALAIREGGTLVTGDPELRELADMFAVEWIG